jgi:hypothetical protein
MDPDLRQDDEESNADEAARPALLVIGRHVVAKGAPLILVFPERRAFASCAPQKNWQSFIEPT